MANDFVVFSVDIAEGLEGDYSCIQVLRLEFDGEKLIYRQIMKFVSNTISVELFADLTTELFNAFNIDYCKLLVESNNYGDSFFKCVMQNQIYEVPLESVLKFKRNSKTDEDTKKPNNGFTYQFKSKAYGC